MALKIPCATRRRRTFVTDCSVNHAASYGDGFYARKVFPLLLQLDRLVGQRAKARHEEWKRHFRKRIDRLAIRVRNLVDDLHRRLAYDLVQSLVLRRDSAAVLRNEGDEREGGSPDQDKDRALDAGPCPLPVQAEARVDVSQTRQAVDRGERSLHQQDTLMGRLRQPEPWRRKNGFGRQDRRRRGHERRAGHHAARALRQLGRFRTAGADVALVAE